MSQQLCPYCQTSLPAHEAGRCLDAWAAKRAGWADVDRSLMDGLDWVGTPPGGVWSSSQIPDFSTDISAAMGLLEGLPYELIVRPTGHAPVPVLCEIQEWRVDQWREAGQGEGHTPAEAIAKAFIAWKEMG